MQHLPQGGGFGGPFFYRRSPRCPLIGSAANLSWEILIFLLSVKFRYFSSSQRGLQNPPFTAGLQPQGHAVPGGSPARFCASRTAQCGPETPLPAETAPTSLRPALAADRTPGDPPPPRGPLPPSLPRSVEGSGRRWSPACPGPPPRNPASPCSTGAQGLPSRLTREVSFPGTQRPGASLPFTRAGVPGLGCQQPGGGRGSRGLRGMGAPRDGTGPQSPRPLGWSCGGPRRREARLPQAARPAHQARPEAPLGTPRLSSPRSPCRIVREAGAPGQTPAAPLLQAEATGRGTESPLTRLRGTRLGLEPRPGLGQRRREVTGGLLAEWKCRRGWRRGGSAGC